MYPKIRSLFTLMLSMVLFTAVGYDSNPLVFNERPALNFDFESCNALGASASTDYSEMQAFVIQNSECTDLSMISPSLYRANPQVNRHSCAPGFQGGTAMCVSGRNSCDFIPNALEAIRVNIVVAPGPDGLGALDNISFHSKSPEFFEFIDGTTGLNNYPTRLRVRISSQLGEVYLSDEIATTLDWTFKTFDLEDVPGLTVTKRTTFQIEILPFCLVGNGATSKAWDIDNLSISAGCTSLDGGDITTTSNTDFCSTDNSPAIVDLNVTDARGDGFAWIALDRNNNLVRVSDVPSLNFQGLTDSQYFIHHLAYVGPISGLNQGAAFSNIQGCFDLSNPIEVLMRQVNGGNLLTSTGVSDVDYCFNIGNSSFLTDLRGNVGTTVQFALVDGSGIIQRVYNTGSIDLLGIPSGGYRLFAVSSDGPIVNLGMGGNINNVIGCFALSNAIIVNINAEGVSAGSLSMNGLTTVDFCGEPGLLDLDLVGASGANSGYVVTNFNGNILRVQDALPIDLSSLTERQCFVRHISYVDGLTGLSIGQIIADLDGCFELSNAVVVNKNNGIGGLGGTLTTPDGGTSFTVCPNQNNFVFTANLVGNGGSNVLYILTDGDDIRFVYDTPIINLAFVDSGDYALTAISFDGVLTGLTIGQSLSGIDGCFELSNSIDISTTSANLDGGVLTVMGGQSSIDLCNVSSGLGLELTGAVGTLSTFIVTDLNGDILLLSDNAIDDLSGINVAQCNLWHISYEPGISGLEIGQSALQLAGCFDLSDPVSVTKNNVNGGSVTSNGSDTLNLCLTDAFITSVPVSLEGAMGTSNDWVITTAAGDIIQITAPDVNGNIDLDNSLPSLIQIFNVSYDGSISNLVVGSNVNDLTADCLDLSSPLIVISETAIGGSIDGPVTYDICLNDVGNTSLTLSISDNVGAFNTWLVTDKNGNVLETNTTSSFDFAGTPADTCLIYHLAHTETPIAYSGPPSIANLDLACFDLSDPVSVNRKGVESGTLSLDNGEASTTIIIDPANPTLLTVGLDGATGDSNSFVVTDTTGVIQSVQDDNQFAFNQAGVCFIQNVSFCGALQNLSVGASLTDISGCFDLSNQIQVIKEEVIIIDTLFAGTILTSDSLTTADICLGLMSLTQTVDLIFQDLPSGGDSSIYVVTDDIGLILETSQTPSFDFDAAGIGVCNIYHLVYDSITGLTIGENINQLSGDFDLSNPITVTRTAVQGGTLTTTDSLTSIEVVVGDGLVDVIGFISDGAQGDSTVVVITDTQGRIIEFPVLPLMFDNDSAGVCMVWNLTFNEPLVGLSVGELVADLDGCFALSNPVTITKSPFVNNILEGGILSIDRTQICLGLDSIVIATLTSAQGEFSDYAVTDTSGLILEVIDSTAFTGTTLTFGANVPSGICEIVHISSDDSLTGLTVGENIDTLGGNFSISNAVTVDRRAVDGGILTTPSGLDTFNIIVGEGIVDSIAVNLSGAIGDTTQWVVTDEAGVVITLAMTSPFVFEAAGPGTCLIWNLSSSFGSSIAVGDNATQLDGCYDLSNPITVIRTEFMTPPVDTLVGGLLGANLSQLCLGQDSVVVTTLLMAEGQNSDFAVTDTSGLILEVIGSTAFTGTTITFDANTPVGLCEIVHISSDSTLTGLTVGEDIDTLGGNFALSNVVTLDKRAVDGGVLTTPSGLDTFNIIVGEGIVDSIAVNLSGAIGDTTQWVVTDEAGVVITLAMTSPFVFEAAGPGTCLIWNLSSSFGSSIAVGDNATQLDGCYDLSNPITVIRTEFMTPPMDTLVGGLLGANLSQLCLGQDSVVVTTLLMAEGQSSDFAVTDTSGLILEVIGSTAFTGTTITFDASTPVGLCEIVHISSDSTLTGLIVGEDIDTLGGNFALSNVVTLDKRAVDGGVLTTPSGLDTFNIIVGDGIIDSIEVNLNGAIGDTTQWVVTDAAGIVLDLSMTSPFVFEAAGPGTCLIWNLSSSFGSSIAVGDNATMLSGCYDLSNAIVVNREQQMTGVNGGVLTTVDGLDTVSICLNTMMTTLDSILLTGVVGDSSAFILTDATGFILAEFDNPPFNFVNTFAGTCFVNHISYNGSIMNLAAGSFVNQIMGDFDLSNAITVLRDDAEGGTLMTVDSLTEVTITVGDMMPDSIDVILDGFSGDTMQWVITDTFGIIVDLPVSEPFDFTNSAPGVCQIWNLSYATGLTGLALNNNVSGLEGCFELSNPITVTKEGMTTVLAGGTLMTSDSMTSAEICLNGFDQSLDLILTENQGANSDFVVTNTAGQIIGVFDAASFNFSGSAPGECDIVHVSSDSTLTGLTLGAQLDSLGGNFDLSNSVNVTKVEFDGGILLFTNNTFSDTILVGDGVDDVVNLLNTNASGDSIIFVLTTATDTILDVQTTTSFVISDSLDPGLCRIRSVAFGDDISGVEIGNDFNLDLAGCFDASNLVTIVKEAITTDTLIAGTIATLAGGDTLDLCIGANGGIIDLTVAGAIGPNEGWVLTDTLGNIFAAPTSLPVTLNSLVADVCEFRHIVYDSIFNLTFNSHLDSLTGSFLFSNVVTINKSELAGNSITLANGATSIDITVADGMIDSLMVTSTGIATDTSVYLLVDANGVIQSVQDTNLFTFGPQISSTCQIYEASFDFGFTGIVPGADIDEIEGCFALSNAIIVNKTSVFMVNGGVVTSTQGNNITICTTDMVNDTIFASVTSAMGSNNAWVITDMNMNIVDLPLGPPFVLDTSSLDLCQIWHVSFEDPLTGLVIGNNVSALSGTFDFNDSPITVTKNSSVAGTLTLPGGGSVDSLFLGSAPVDSVFVNLTGVAADTSSWIVTDTLGNIILIPDGEPPFAFESLTPGICELWNVAYSFGLSGLQNGNNPNTDFDGCFEISNSITVVKTQATNTMASGGVITLPGGGTEFMRCTGNSTLDSIEVVASGQSGTNFTYFITNKFGNIVNIQDTVQFLQDTTLVNVEFNGDTLFLYHVGFDTLTGFNIPATINNLGGSFGLSDPILLTREQIGAGIINTTSNTTVISGDGIADDILINQIGTVTGDTTFYVVYDDQNIIQLVTDTSTIDFDTFATGTYFVTFIAANLGYSGIEVGNNLADIEGCFDLATPIQIDVTQATVSGGVLTTPGGNVAVDLCFDSMTSLDSVDVVLTDTLGLGFTWVVTDNNGVILDLPASPPFFFDDQDSLTCEIFNLSFDSTVVGLNIGEDIDALMSNGIFVFSNPIVVNKSVVSGGSLTTAAGALTEEVCIGEGGFPDQLFMTLTGAVGSELTYVVTDTDSLITEVINGGTTAITVESFEGDTCLVFNLSANAEILGLTTGSDLNQLTGCFELSNSITLIKNNVDAGVLSSIPFIPDNVIDFCVTDGVPDSLVVSTNSTAGSYQLVLTDEDDVITQIATSDTFNFEGSAFGTCRIYGVSFTGSFTGTVGDTLTQVALSDDCFVSTAIPITVNKLDCSQPIINEIYDDNQVELKNIGTASIDLTNYWLCTNAVYAQLGNQTLTCGTLILDPGEFVVVDVDGNLSINNDDGEMGLYVDSSFGQSSSIRSYVEWGSTGHLRSGIAVIAGLWTTGEFAAPFAAGMSLHYDGDGILGSDWSEVSPSECADSFAPGGGPASSAINYQFFPNPAQEHMTLVVENLPEDEGRLVIYDSYGKVVMTQTINGETTYEMDLTAFGPGVYHAKVISGRADKVSRLMILE